MSNQVTDHLVSQGKNSLGQVHESRPGCVSQGHRKVVDYDSLIASSSKDRGGVDIQELDGVDSLVIFLRQVGPKLMRPDHHAKVWSKRHASACNS
jgi:hypothetical protein